MADKMWISKAADHQRKRTEEDIDVLTYREAGSRDDQSRRARVGAKFNRDVRRGRFER